jgi:glycosyltransferase involved in cell wall biosynthesis
MRASIRALCADWGLEPPPIQVLRPPVRSEIGASTPSRYGFQLFYPASDFAHKRTDLAIAGAALAAKRAPDVGLVVTAQSDGTGEEGVTRLPWLSRAEVGGEYGAASALLFTSAAETLGLPLLEALDRGLPAVLPDLPYAREVYADAAVYFGDPTPRAVSEAILTLRREIGRYRALAVDRRLEVRELEASWNDHWRAFLDAIPANPGAGG